DLRDISLRSGRLIADSLAGQGASVTVCDPDASLFEYLQQVQPDVVWPALHGASGEDGSLRSLLDTLGVPYIGARGPAARLAWDKPTAKSLVASAGLATPQSLALSRDSCRDLGAANVLEQSANGRPGPHVGTRAQGGSAQGVSLVADPANELAGAMVNAYRYWDVALVERRIE